MSTETSGVFKQLVSWVMLFIALLLVVSLTKGIFEILSVYDRVAEAENEVAELEAKKRSLERQVAERTTEGYVERQIRNKLHLSRPGEQVVVLSENSPLQTNGQSVRVDREVPVWQQWMELFL
jgi:cell division protein FtsB